MIIQCRNIECEHEFDVETEYIPGEMYGTDADGNRGVWQEPQRLYSAGDLVCPECSTVMTEQEVQEAIDEEPIDSYEHYGPDE